MLTPEQHRAIWTKEENKLKLKTALDAALAPLKAQLEAVAAEQRELRAAPLREWNALVDRIRTTRKLDAGSAYLAAARENPRLASLAHGTKRGG